MAALVAAVVQRFRQADGSKAARAGSWRRRSCGGDGRRTVSLAIALALASIACTGRQGPVSPSVTGGPGSVNNSPAPSPLPSCVKLTISGTEETNLSRPGPMPVSFQTIQVGGRTDSIIVDRAGHRVFVLDGIRDSIAVVDAATLRVVTRIPVSRSYGAAGMAQDTTTGLLYVVSTKGMVSVVDPAARVVRKARFALPKTLVNVYASAVGGSKLWVADSKAGLLILDLATLQVVGRIDVRGPIDIALDPWGSQAFVTSASRLWVIDTITNQPVRCLKTGGWLAFNPTRNLLYLALMKSDKGAALRVIDAGSMALVAIVRGGIVPVDVEVDPKAGRVYVVDAGAYNIEAVDPAAGLVWIVDAHSNRLLRTLAIGISPMAAALSGDGRVLFIATAPGSLSRLILPRRTAGP